MGLLFHWKAIITNIAPSIFGGKDTHTHTFSLLPFQSQILTGYFLSNQQQFHYDRDFFFFLKHVLTDKVFQVLTTKMSLEITYKKIQRKELHRFLEKNSKLSMCFLDLIIKLKIACWFFFFSEIPEVPFNSLTTWYFWQEFVENKFGLAFTKYDMLPFGCCYQVRVELLI